MRAWARWSRFESLSVISRARSTCATTPRSNSRELAMGETVRLAAGRRLIALNSYARATSALELYDTIVLPMELNGDREFLSGLPSKDRVTLFANAGCALTCPSKICYVSISKYNKSCSGEFKCSQPLKQRDMLGMIDFDLAQLQELGFHRFKLLRTRPGGQTGY